MLELIMFALGIYLLYLFIVHVVPVILAVMGAGLMIVAAVAGLIGAIIALKNYGYAMFKNINFRKWEWPRGTEPARRSYFFGPGYVQLWRTIKTAFRKNLDSGLAIADKANDLADYWDGCWGWIVRIACFIYKIVSYIIIFGIGTALCGLFALAHGAITTGVMVITYVIFTVVWLVDWLYLMKNKIRSDCPVCKERFLIPHFKCPDCGEMHRKLVPGPYGIWTHRCSCGRKLPATFLNGRSNLESFCPNCGSPLVASDARPTVLQLIGGSNAGKSVYLAAFFHEFLEKLNSNPNLKVTIADQYQPYFDDLADWFNGGDCPATTELNSQMYPILVDSKLGVRRQFSIYDIAGEMFDGATADSVIQQQQFQYCDGLLFLLDPFSSGRLREERVSSGGDMSDFSSMPAEDVTSNFINYLIRTGHAKPNARCDIPIAVMIAKADIREVRRVIGPAKIHSLMHKDDGQFLNYDEARDTLCREFLMDIGLASAVNELEAQFTNLHYYPISAMGHSPDGSPYEPWGIMEAVEWLLPLADQEFSDLVYPKLISNT